MMVMMVMEVEVVVMVVELGGNLRVRQQGTGAEQNQGVHVSCVGRILYRCG
jgi:hypothetical protein